MKIATLTFHTALNFGAVFQTYALYRVLKEKGHHVRVIDYHAPFNEKRFAPKTLRYFLNLRTLYGIFFHNSFEIYYKDGFHNFIKNHIELTEPIYDSPGLKSLNSQFDTFISGSDQVWNLACTEGDEAYFLPFVTEKHKRNSYAASIGYTILPAHAKARYKKLMSGFNHISVRESPGVRIVKDLTDKDAKLVLDPTFLLDKYQWSQVADFSLVPEGKKYLLIYVMSEDKVLLREAREYANLHNLQTLYITQRFFRLPWALNLRNITPEQWLGLFMKADFIVTNSFHGLAFAINFNRQFITRYIPRSIANSRLETVLDNLDLHFRRIDSSSYSSNSIVNYDIVNKNLLSLRTKSFDFLNVIVNEGE